MYLYRAPKPNASCRCRASGFSTSHAGSNTALALFDAGCRWRRRHWTSGRLYRLLRPSGAKESVSQGCSAAASDPGCTRRAGLFRAGLFCACQNLSHPAQAATTVVHLLPLSTLLPTPQLPPPSVAAVVTTSAAARLQSPVSLQLLLVSLLLLLFLQLIPIQ